MSDRLDIAKIIQFDSEHGVSATDTYATINKRIDAKVIEARQDEHDLAFNNYVELSEEAYTAWCYERDVKLAELRKTL